MVHHLELPHTPAGSLLNLQRGVTPLAGGHLLVHPLAAQFQFLVTDRNGEARVRYHVPNDRALVGLPLFFQGGLVDRAARIALTNGLVVRVAP